jgi:membrane protease YdiL (CAAX protease family)
MLTILVFAVLGFSYLFGFIAAKIWNKDSRGWKLFPTFFTFLPALISILVYYFYTSKWSFGDFSFTKIEYIYILLGFFTPIILFAINLMVHIRSCAGKIKVDVNWKKILAEIPLGILFSIIFIAGEEIGWRGFLQTLLIDSLGIIVGIILLGFVWGIWHAPIALRGYNLKSHFWAEAFILYPFMCICYSFPLAFLTIASGSIWPALIFHATNNTLGSLGTEIIEKQDTKREILILMGTGIILAIPFAYLLFQ